ncbi:NADPH dehydrogenase NamA [Alkaliphilus oremlandii]|uniref:NADH:flavin oxidoreductase/NADH oxidase n=1 Tax=Alkaliphilus oremlandii (strain OhILAs) TaxID=350688 RepID=A8MLN6_ALKOO|nr:NADPH dehydrogenase NamA [Alkaliphilus oremlandii]ABW17953.1 NADH:flavin oxidoreductase/NADH oxidase [Alkaliphilus oremlandii OhILAs]
MSKLFHPYTLKNLELKNRIVMAPMCQYSADEEGFPTSWHTVHYATRAIGGVGLIILEATAVEPRGRISANDLGIWKEEHVDGLKALVAECKKYGAQMGIQLAHAGRKCSINSENIVAPSPVAFSHDYQTPRELTKKEIQTIVQSFKLGAQRSLEAGFDIIEIHGAHGYLINEFLSPLSNQRTDEYGGSLENRVRFLKEILEAVRTVWPKELPMILRVSAEDYVAEGNHPEDLAAMINLLKDYEVDIVNVSSGAVVPAPIKAYPGYQIPFSEIIKRETNLPTIGGGLVTTPLMAEEILQNNRADLIFLGRELLRNPYWALHAAKEVRDDVPWPVQYERGK